MLTRLFRRCTHPRRALARALGHHLSTATTPAGQGVVAGVLAELRTAYRAPRQNATCARFLSNVRREFLDHLLILSEGTCDACCGNTRVTSTRPGRIRLSASTSPVTLLHPRCMREVWATYGHSRCSVASTTHIGEPRSPGGQAKRPRQAVTRGIAPDTARHMRHAVGTTRCLSDCLTRRGGADMISLLSLPGESRWEIMPGRAPVTTPAAGARIVALPRPRLTYRTMQKVWGFIFVSPVLLLFLVFRLYPMLRAVAMSFQKYDLLTPPRWIGWDNYAFLFSNERVLNSFKVTGVFLVGQTIPLVLVALLLALVLFSLPRFRHVFEVAFYFPVIMPTVVAALIWLTLFYPRGLLDQLVAPWAPHGVPWLTSPVLALPSVITVDIWKSTGYYMIILLAGLLGVPIEYLDAAAIDGAGAWARFRYIILPLLRPQLAFVSIIALVNAVQAFDSFYVLTRGGPADATRILPIEVYLRAFQLLEMGRAAAISMVMFVFLLVLTVIQLRFFRIGDL